MRSCLSLIQNRNFQVIVCSNLQLFYPMFYFSIHNILVELWGILWWISFRLRLPFVLSWHTLRGVRLSAWDCIGLCLPIILSFYRVMLPIQGFRVKWVIIDMQHAPPAPGYPPHRSKSPESYIIERGCRGVHMLNRNIVPLLFLLHLHLIIECVCLGLHLILKTVLKDFKIFVKKFICFVIWKETRLYKTFNL